MRTRSVSNATNAAGGPPTERTAGRAWPPLSAIACLAALGIERLIRGRRLLALCALFLLPTAIILLGRYANPDGIASAEAEEGIIFYMIPQALLPLAALVLASGIVQDEVEEQTLTYLLVRPLPRWLIYVTKLLGVIVISVALCVAFTALALTAIHAGTADFTWADVRGRWPRIIGLMALACVPYAAIFGFFSVFLKRVLVVGVAYILLFEGLFANIDFVVRKATVMYYTRVLAQRWLGLYVSSWSIDLDEAATGVGCLVRLLGVALLATVLAAILFSVSEYRLKTPESS